MTFHDLVEIGPSSAGTTLSSRQLQCKPVRGEATRTIGANGSSGSARQGQCAAVARCSSGNAQQWRGQGARHAIEVTQYRRAAGRRLSHQPRAASAAPAPAPASRRSAQRRAVCDMGDLGGSPTCGQLPPAHVHTPRLHVLAEGAVCRPIDHAHALCMYSSGAHAGSVSERACLRVTSIYRLDM